MSNNIHIIKGWIKELTNHGDDEVLCLVDKPDETSLHSKDGEERAISAIASKLIEQCGNEVSVRYWTSNLPIENVEIATQEFLKGFYGDASANYEMHYSDVTGHLWTDDDFVVGGHDMIKELSTYEGKYLLMELDFSEPDKSYKSPDSINRKEPDFASFAFLKNKQIHQIGDKVFILGLELRGVVYGVEYRPQQVSQAPGWWYKVGVDAPDKKGFAAYTFYEVTEDKLVSQDKL